MNPAEELKKAFAPLVERAKRRSQRIKHLQGQPPTEQTTKAIAAETRENSLIFQTALAVEKVLDTVQRQSRYEVAAAHVAAERVQEVVEDATHYEALFHRALLLPVGDPPDEQWPAVARRAQWAMYRMQHLRTSPTTYADTFGLKPTA